MEGFVIDKNKTKLKFLYGRWTEFLCSTDPANLEAFLECKLDKVSAPESRTRNPVERDPKY